MTRSIPSVCIAAALALAVPAAAGDPPAGKGAGAAPAYGRTDSKKWQFEIIPYVWMAGVHGTAETRRFSRDFDVSFGDILDNFDMGLMGAIQARSGRWALFADIAFVDVSTDVSGPRGRSVGFDPKYFLGELAAFYRLSKDPSAKNGTLEAMLGMRYQQFDLNAKGFRGNELNASRNTLDPIVGLRYRRDLGKKIYVVLEGDVGGFGLDSDLTYGFWPTFGYQLSRKYDLLLGYRYLFTDVSNDNASVDYSLRGPVLGFRYIW